MKRTTWRSYFRPPLWLCLLLLWILSALWAGVTQARLRALERKVDRPVMRFEVEDGKLKVTANEPD